MILETNASLCMPRAITGSGVAATAVDAGDYGNLYFFTEAAPATAETRWNKHTAVKTTQMLMPERHRWE